MRRPFYLPLKFTSVMIGAVDIPPQANMHTALSELHEAQITNLINTSPAPPGVEGDWTIATQQLGTATLNNAQCFGAALITPASFWERLWDSSRN